MKYGLISTCLIAVASPACNGDARPAAHFAAADSAGVRVVDLTIVPWQAESQWHLSAEPELQIGVQTGDPAYELHGVNAARRLSDGRIAVSNSGTSEIRVYDPTGRFLHSIGRKGEGPGEFTELGGFEVLAADTVLAIDFERRGVMAFAPDDTPSWIRGFDLGSCGWFVEEWPITTRLPDGSLMNSVSRMMSGIASAQASRRPARPTARMHSSCDIRPGAALRIRSLRCWPMSTPSSNAMGARARRIRRSAGALRTRSPGAASTSAARRPFRSCITLPTAGCSASYAVLPSTSRSRLPTWMR
jgi:hypothetical protein